VPSPCRWWSLARPGAEPWLVPKCLMKRRVLISAIGFVEAAGRGGRECPGAGPMTASSEWAMVGSPRRSMALEWPVDPAQPDAGDGLEPGSTDRVGGMELQARQSEVGLRHSEVESAPGPAAPAGVSLLRAPPPSDLVPIRLESSMASNAHSVNDVATQSRCAGARPRHRRATSGSIQRRAQPSTRGPTESDGHAVAERVDCLARSVPRAGTDLRAEVGRSAEAGGRAFTGS